jgi:hypothetical protein
MSKLVSEMLRDIADTGAQPSYQLFVLSVTVDSNGDAEGKKWVTPVRRIQFDKESGECLFHIQDDPSVTHDPSTQPVLLSEFLSGASPARHKYSVCAAQEASKADMDIRIDTPAIGFGENVEQSQYFVVVLSDCDERSDAASDSERSLRSAGRSSARITKQPEPIARSRGGETEVESRTSTGGGDSRAYREIENEPRW